ncbi:MAG: hypothetical protein DID90_2727552394 [Candidatus Nitrotoga sp. LAW]|nr:MAG: hypothetical protein DID90_2727552394 [Candidatus Nitrotoga sp. LAW]
MNLERYIEIKSMKWVAYYRDGNQHEFRLSIGNPVRLLLSTIISNITCISPAFFEIVLCLGLSLSLAAVCFILRAQKYCFKYLVMQAGKDALYQG